MKSCNYPVLRAERLALLCAFVFAFFWRISAQNDTVNFSWITAHSSHSAVAITNDQHDSTWSAFCDVLYTGSPLATGLAVVKSDGTKHSSACYPEAPVTLYVVGSGMLLANTQGYFELPGLCSTGSSLIELQGAGPHKVIWHAGAPEQLLIHEQVQELPVWNSPTNMVFDLLGRSSNGGQIQINYNGKKWVRTVKID